MGRSAFLIWGWIQTMMSKFRKKAIKERIEYLEGNISYNDAPGVHTYSMCACGRKSSRCGDCNLCIQERIDKLNKELKDAKLEKSGKTE